MGISKKGLDGRIVMGNWQMFVATAKEYPEHLFKKCPDCGGQFLSIPTGDYYEVEDKVLMPGDQICLSCKAFMKGHPVGKIWGATPTVILTGEYETRYVPKSERNG